MITSRIVKRTRAVPLSFVRKNTTATATATATRPQPPPPPPPPTPQQEPQFSSLKNALSTSTLSALLNNPFNFTQMSPVQAAVLPLLPDLASPHPADPGRHDLLVRAKTGTGKTLAFLVPAVESRQRAIDERVNQALHDANLPPSDLLGKRDIEARAKRAVTFGEVGALIISPTRELATQIAVEAEKLISTQDKRNGKMEVRLLIGGESRRGQLREWQRGRKDIVVATPGRLRDLLESEDDVLSAISQTKQLILDEADTLLDMGFSADIESITSNLPRPPNRQTFLFSATVSRAIQQIARATLSPSHKYINCVPDSTSPVHAHIPQYHTVLPSAQHQLPHILRLIAHDQLTHPTTSKIIIFLPTTKMTQLFTTALKELTRPPLPAHRAGGGGGGAANTTTTILPAGHNTKIFEIHSKRTQEARTRASDAFRATTSGASVLVTSDVSARGVDYPGVTRVVQVGVPGSREQYVHRVGRTGRAGGGSSSEGKKATGRGDLVLLPFEMGFVRRQLGDVGLKPVRVEEVEREVGEMVGEFESDPKGFFERATVALSPTSTSTSTNSGNVGSGGTRTRMGGRASYGAEVLGPNFFPSYSPSPSPSLSSPTPSSLSTSLSPSILQTLIQTNLLSRLDPPAIEETFMSLLGYYTSKTGEMGCSREEVLEGCKKWAVEAFGLEREPEVGSAFLKKLGFVDGGRGRGGAGGFGRGRGGRGREEDTRRSGYGMRSASGGERRASNKWLGGNVVDGGGGAARRREDTDDGFGREEEFVKPRYERRNSFANDRNDRRGGGGGGGGGRGEGEGGGGGGRRSNSYARARSAERERW